MIKFRFPFFLILLYHFTLFPYIFQSPYIHYIDAIIQREEWNQEVFLQYGKSRLIYALGKSGSRTSIIFPSHP